MEDLIKKFVHTGVGFIALTAEKFQKTVDSLVDDGKISTEEGKRIVNDLFENTESKKAELEAKFKEMAEEVIARFSFARKEDLDQLTARIESLEDKLAAGAESDDKKVAKKATTKSAEA